MVTGPSLRGFIRQHWDALASGRKLRVRLIVLHRKTSYGVDLRMMRRADGMTTSGATPSSALVRMVTEPLLVTFSDSARRLVRCEGRVPPKQTVGGKLKDLDARVEYFMVSSVYR